MLVNGDYQTDKTIGETIVADDGASRPRVIPNILDGTTWRHAAQLLASSTGG